MTDDGPDWTYGSDLGSERAGLLRKPGSFCDIATRIGKSVMRSKITFSIDEGYTHPVTGSLRPAFTFPVEQAAGDAFFNGLFGYRAHYYRSPAAGEEANRILIDTMFDELLEAAGHHRFTVIDGNGKTLTMDRKAVEVSLKSPSAKVWPFEDEETNSEFHQIVTAGDPLLTVDIRAPRWLHYAEMGIVKAKKGLRAPCVHVLEVKGGFITSGGDERITENKALRSCEIHKLGFT
jgi:hypothetical protein